MILKQLSLQNIRSYLNETVTFPDGNVLLSGDIGGGKSTILLAVEFALFGRRGRAADHATRLIIGNCPHQTNGLATLEGAFCRVERARNERRNYVTRIGVKRVFGPQKRMSKRDSACFPAGISSNSRGSAWSDPIVPAPITPTSIMLYSYFPLNTGFRFSMNAWSPSEKSLLPMAS